MILCGRQMIILHGAYRLFCALQIQYLPMQALGASSVCVQELHNSKEIVAMWVWAPYYV